MNRRKFKHNKQTNCEFKAQLRASVVTAINEYEGLNSGTYMENMGAKKIRDHFEGIYSTKF